MYPSKTQWFCWSLSLLNGYFIGGIPHFQTYPHDKTMIKPIELPSPSPDSPDPPSPSPPWLRRQARCSLVKMAISPMAVARTSARLSWASRCSRMAMAWVFWRSWGENHGEHAGKMWGKCGEMVGKYGENVGKWWENCWENGLRCFGHTVFRCWIWC